MMDKIPFKIGVEFDRVKVLWISMLVIAILIVVCLVIVGVAFHSCQKSCVDARHCFDRFKISKSNQETLLLDKCLSEPDVCTQQC